ncbi:MAG: secreted protein containing, partial [Polaromonas sp.]|nr:secreted protein containing [Polaromonas sp.]
MNIRKFGHTKRVGMHAVAGAIAILGAGSAAAIELNTGNDDVKLRWDNTVRYNLGTRMESPDSRILASPSYDE